MTAARCMNSQASKSTEMTNLREITLCPCHLLYVVCLHFRITTWFCLHFRLQGNDHVIFNGSFFYLHYESESIVRYDLTTLYSRKVRIPRNRVVRNSGLPVLSKLYGPQQEVWQSLIDIDIDIDVIHEFYDCIFRTIIWT